MVERLADKIAKFICTNVDNDADIYEVYKYGIEITISTLLNIFCVIIASLVVSDILSGLIFLAAYMSIKPFVGGYHANSYLMCNVVFVMTFLLVYASNLALLMINDGELCKIIVQALSISGFLPIIIYAPVENKNKPLDEKRKPRFRKIGISLYILIALVGLGLFYGHLKYGSFIVITLISVSVMILFEKILQRRRKKMKVKKTIAKAFAAVSVKIAKTSCNSVSAFGTYQPKEPAALKKMAK